MALDVVQVQETTSVSYITVEEEPETVVEIRDSEVELVSEHVVGPPGPKGDKGDQGDQGEMGPPGAGATERYEFPIPANEWEMIHGMNVIPEVIVLDTLGRPGEPWEIEYPDNDTVIVRHLNAMAGSAILNF